MTLSVVCRLLFVFLLFFGFNSMSASILIALQAVEDGEVQKVLMRGPSLVIG